MNDKLTQQLKRHEGFRKYPYYCTAQKLTIGVGRNLEAKGISAEESAFMLANDIDDATIDAQRYLGADLFDRLDEVRQCVIINMSFNLGFGRLSRFKKLKLAITGSDFVWAAAEMKDSRWYNQVGIRGKELVKQMESGEWQF